MHAHSLCGPMEHAGLGVVPSDEGDLGFLGLDKAWEWVKGAAKTVGDGISDAVSAVDKLYVGITPRWFRQGVGVFTLSTPIKMSWDIGKGLVEGQRVDRVLLGAVNNQVEVFKGAAPYAQIGLSFIPGIGTGISAAIGAGMALASGRPITAAIMEGVKGAIPGGPLVQAAFTVAAQATMAAAGGKNIGAAALDALRIEAASRLPAGPLREGAKIAFDSGLALAQGRSVQETVGMAARPFVPKDPLAQGAFEATLRVMEGKGTAAMNGATESAMAALVDPAAARTALLQDALRRANIIHETAQAQIRLLNAPKPREGGVHAPTGQSPRAPRAEAMAAAEAKRLADEKVAQARLAEAKRADAQTLAWAPQAVAARVAVVSQSPAAIALGFAFVSMTQGRGYFSHFPGVS